MKVVKTMHYCKSNLKTGCDHKENCKCKPIIVNNMGKEKPTKKFVMDLWEKDEFGVFQPVRIQCIFGNTRGKAKTSGAKAMLEVLKHD